MTIAKNNRRLLWLALAAGCALAVTLAAAPMRDTPVSLGGPMDRILVEKHAHRLSLLRGGKVIKTYRVALGRGGPGPKLKAGDNKVPEGIYQIVARNPRSEFHRSLQVGYPTSAQRRLDALRGINPGDDIMLHGIRNGLGWLGPLHRTVDWTRGCIGVTDSEIEEIWRAVPNGTPIEIRP